MVFAICVPGYMIGYSPTDYSFLDIRLVFSFGSALALLCSVALLVLYLVVGIRYRENNPVRPVVLFLLFWVCLTGFLLPATSSATQVDAVNIPADYRNMGIVAVLATGMTFMVMKAAGKYVAAFVVVLLSTSLASVAPNIYQLLEHKEERAAEMGLTRLSSGKNIIVVSFDALPGGMVRKVLAEDPALRSRFKDFISYENVVASGPGTVTSIAGELRGSGNLKALGGTKKKMLKNFDKKALLLNSPTHDVYAYGRYATFMLEKTRRIGKGQLSGRRGIDDVIDFYQFVIARVGSRHAVKMVAPFTAAASKGLAAKTARIDGADGALDLSRHRGQRWDKKFLKTIDDYYAFVSALNVGRSKDPAIRYLHFTFTHNPVAFDEDCQYRAYDKKWNKTHNNASGATSEVKCSMKLFGLFLDKLETIGLYDSTLIVLKSDHGKNGRHYSSSPENMCINGKCYTTLGRYLPFLKIKPPHRHSETSLVVEDMVLLDDLARTLCVATGGGKDCDKFVGIDLLAADRSRGGPFFIMLPKNKNSSKFRTHKMVKLQRSKSLLESMKANRSIRISARR